MRLIENKKIAYEKQRIEMIEANMREYDPQQYIKKVMQKRCSQANLRPRLDSDMTDALRNIPFNMSTKHLSPVTERASYKSTQGIESISQVSTKPLKKKRPSRHQEIFFQACKKNNVVYVKKNLTRLSKDDFNSRDRDGNSPLYIAVSYGNLEMAKYLIKLGADIHGINQYGILFRLKSIGNTALHKAMLINDWDLIYLLLEKGADITALNDFDQTPTFFANKSLSHKVFIPTLSHMDIYKGKVRI